VVAVLSWAALAGAADPSWQTRVAPEDEPGEPMVVTGTVFAADGETPVAGVNVHVYHTDRNGYYNRDGATAGADVEHRLQGDMVTDAKGRYRYETIRPARYPGDRIPAHVHYVLTTPDGRTLYRELHFADDDKLSDLARRRSAKRGRFGSIRPIEKDADGVWRVEFDLELE